MIKKLVQAALFITSVEALGGAPQEAFQSAPSFIGDAQMLVNGDHDVFLAGGYTVAAVEDHGDDIKLDHSFEIIQYQARGMFRSHQLPLFWGLRLADEKAQVTTRFKAGFMTPFLEKSKGKYDTQEVSPVLGYRGDDPWSFALALELKSYIDRLDIQRQGSDSYESLPNYKAYSLRLNPSFAYFTSAFELTLSYRPYSYKQDTNGDVKEPQYTELGLRRFFDDSELFLGISHKKWGEIRDADSDRIVYSLGYQQPFLKNTFGGYFSYQPSYAKSGSETTWSNMSKMRWTLLVTGWIEDTVRYDIRFYHEQGSAWRKEDAQLSDGSTTTIKKDYRLSTQSLLFSISQAF